MTSRHALAAMCLFAAGLFWSPSASAQACLTRAACELALCGCTACFGGLTEGPCRTTGPIPGPDEGASAQEGEREESPLMANTHLFTRRKRGVTAMRF